MAGAGGEGSMIRTVMHRYTEVMEVMEVMDIQSVMH